MDQDLGIWSSKRGMLNSMTLEEDFFFFFGLY